ncbi:hypothetical protein B0H11DRAFT_1750498 [Mycena galericulata]|nr:hypothetical protein B0H11DRAFT_1750498 [Mycena galericulata]
MAAPPTPRQIVVDDTDPAIHYSQTGWFVAAPASLNTLGNFGPIFNDTSHGASSNASLTFGFSGTSITVFGTIMVSTVNNVTDPTWTCSVDEIPISSPNPTFKFPENNWVLCQQSQITSGSHNLTIQVQSKGQAFYLDYLVYTPTPDVSLESAVVIYPNTDPSVSFGAGWSTFGGENGTQTNEAQVSLNFHGTSVSPYAFVPTELPHNATWATYTIDGGPPVNFTLQGLAPGSASSIATEYNVILFTAQALSSATHNLVITYGGDGNHTPLVIQGFYVTNTTTLALASSPSSSPNGSASSTSPTSSTSSDSTSHHSSSGAIAGGVIGGLVLLALLAGLAFWLRRRRRDDAQQATAANPYPMGMANGHAPPVGQPSGSRAPNGYPSVAGAAYPLPPTMDMSSSGGMRSDVSNPSTTYPGSVAAVASHGTLHEAVLPTPQATPPVGPRSLPPKIARESAAAAALAPPSPSTASPNTVVLRHEDSGVRLPRASEPLPEILELPPGYSPD